MSSPGKKDAGAVTGGAAVKDGKADTKKDSSPAENVLELLEEDDEFEEFEGANWEDAKGDTEDGQLWQDDWDDDDVHDDFAQQLRQQIDANAAAPQATTA